MARTRVVTYLGDAAADELLLRARAARRSVSEFAAMLLEGALDGGDRGGSDALQGADAVHLSGRGREPREDGASPPSSDIHFKPDPKSGKH